MHYKLIVSDDDLIINTEYLDMTSEDLQTEYILIINYQLTLWLKPSTLYGMV